MKERLMMNKKLYGLISVLFFMSFCPNQAKALTVDFIELFDSNNTDKIEFGDNTSDKDNYFESEYLSSVIKKFEISSYPEQNSLFEISITYEGDDSRANNYFILNGQDFNPLSNGNGTKTYSAENSLLIYGENEITFNIEYVNSTWGLDDFSISEFKLEYTAGQQVPSSVPEPSSFLFFGLGIIAFLTFLRKKSKG
jgi:hypothetical protein